MRRFALALALALTLLGTAAAVVFVPPEVREIPAARPIGQLAADLPGWSGTPEVEPGILAEDPRGRASVRWTYQNGHDVVWLSLDYYRSEDEAARPPAQSLLYPGRGWSELSAQPITIPLDGVAGKAIPANLVVMRTPTRQIAVVYWYQVQGRSIGSDHWYRAVMLYNRIVQGRADSALVRLAIPIEATADPAALVARHAKFVQAFYAELLESFAR